jgi:hypothetical protein
LNLLPLDRLPLLPDHILRAHKALHRTDTRFRAAARLRQALWREARGLPLGSYTTPAGTTRKLGSRLSAYGAAAGGNFINQPVHRLAQRDYAYREPGAAIDEERLFGNLLSSMPLAFNLAGPMKLDGAKADAFVQTIAPDAAGRVSAIWFEHSPGRGDPTFLDDGSAFDIFIAMRRADGAKTFLAIEVKYAESMGEQPARLRPRYDQLSRDSALYRDPAAEALRRAPLQQLWREHLLAQTLLTTGLYDAGTFVLIAPKLNSDVQRAAATYAAHLAPTPSTPTAAPSSTQPRTWKANTRAARSPGQAATTTPTNTHLTPHAAFLNLTLEDAITALRTAGGAAEAQALHDRYVDFTPVHALA